MSRVALGLSRLPPVFQPPSLNCTSTGNNIRRSLHFGATSFRSRNVSQCLSPPLWVGDFSQRRGLKVSALSLTSKKRHGHKISMITAYDFPSAIHVARAEIDIILVGDSVAMVELGHSTTQPITVSDMLGHCAAVQRGVTFANVKNPPLLVGDMPFGSYEFENTDIALQNAYRFVKEAGMDAVKLEVR
jgi:Ketopantoate hydroxymethyltransferase